MIGRLICLALAGLPLVIVLDRWRAARRGDRPPEALRMLVVIDAPVEETWAVIADIPLQTEWMREMKRLEMATPGPARVGSRGTATIRILGIRVSDPVEIVELEPPRRYAIRHEGLFRGGGVITLEPGTDGTTTIVRWEETLIPPLLPELGGLLAAPILRAIFQADLERLKRLVETGSADG